MSLMDGTLALPTYIPSLVVLGLAPVRELVLVPVLELEQGLVLELASELVLVPVRALAQEQELVLHRQLTKVKSPTPRQSEQ